MSQKFIKKKQTSPKSLGYGKYYAKDLTASSLSPRILFQPEYTTSTQNGVTRAAVAMLGDITFEEATDYEAPKVASSNQGGGTNQSGSNTGGNNGGGGDNLGQN